LTLVLLLVLALGLLECDVADRVDNLHSHDRSDDDERCGLQKVLGNTFDDVCCGRSDFLSGHLVEVFGLLRVRLVEADHNLAVLEEHGRGLSVGVSL